MSLQITADGTVGPVSVKGPCSIHFSGSFGGGTIAINRQTDGGDVALRDNGTAITVTSADDSFYEIGPCGLKFVMSGSTTPDVRIDIND